MNYYPDQLMPTCIQIEPILPQYRHVIKELMMKHDQGVKESGNPCSSKPRSEHESHFRWNGSRTP